MIVVDDCDGGEGNAPHSTVVAEYKDVERELASQMPMKADGKLTKISGAFLLVSQLKSGLKIQDYVAFYVHTSFLRSSIPCVYIY